MMLLYVLMVSGSLTVQNVELGNESDINCLAAAEELRKSDKVAEAFCVIDDPDNNGKVKIGRYLKDGEATH